MSPDRYRQIVSAFAGKRVAIIGDFSLDQYVASSLRGISPERTVLRIADSTSTYAPGAAGNLAANFANLGADVYAFGSVGEDDCAGILLDHLAALEINTDGLIPVSGQRTTTYLRYIRTDDGSDDHILRVDHERTMEDPAYVMDAILSSIADPRSGFDAVFLSDYNEGENNYSVLTEAAVRSIVSTQKDKPTLLAGSSRKRSAIFSDLDYLYLNLSEAKQLIATIDPKYQALEGQELDDCIRNALNIGNVIVTLGGDGAEISGPGGYCRGAPFRVNAVVDPCGAGDSFAAASFLGLLAKCSEREALDLGNAAAASVLGVKGTEAASLGGLRHRMLNQSFEVSSRGKALSIEELQGELGDSRDKSLVLAVGCFDKLDAGQIRFLREASKLAEILVVAINSDRSVEQNKGKRRPIHPEEDRVEVLSCMDFIDYVTIFDELTEIGIIKKLIRPGDIHVKGFPYQPGEDIVGASIVKSLGGEIVIVEKK